MAVKNSTIMAKVWLEGSNDYQIRVPDPTQATMAETVKALFKPLNGRAWNEFCDTLVQRIGDTVVHQREWENPLSVFKGSKLNYGSTVQEIALNWVKAHSYSDEATAAVLGISRPQAEVCYHSINRQDRYDITVNRDELRQAFAEEYGLNNFVNGILTAPINSDNYDEYRCMLQLLKFYDDNLGFFKVTAPTLQDLYDPTAEPGAGQSLLAMIRTYIELFKFPSTLYNAQVVDSVPVFEKDPSKIVLITIPHVKAALDVFALAQLFHLDKAEVESRIIVVDEMPIEGAVALLTTEDFFVCRDVEYQTASWFNPSTLSTNFFLHHWSVLSVSPFVPAVLFTTDGTTVHTREYRPNNPYESEAPIDETNTNVKLIKIDNQLKGDITEGADTQQGVPMQPETSATYSNIRLYYMVPGSDPVAWTEIEKNSRTYIDRFNRLHLQRKGITEDAPDGVTTYKVSYTVTSTYMDPSDGNSVEPLQSEVAFQVNPDGTYTVVNLVI